MFEGSLYRVFLGKIVGHIGDSCHEHEIDGGVASPVRNCSPPTSGRRPDPLRVVKPVSSSHSKTAGKSSRVDSTCRVGNSYELINAGRDDGDGSSTKNASS